MPAPKIGREYYELGENGTFTEVILSIRADESIHRDVNHKFAEVCGEKEVDAEVEVDKILEKD